MSVCLFISYFSFTECVHLAKKDRPYTNGTHYCMHCTTYWPKLDVLKYGYGCGCNDWKRLYDNGCCFSKNSTEPLHKDGYKLCHLNTVAPIHITYPPLRVVVSHDKHRAINKINTRDTAMSNNYDKVIWAGTIVLFLILIAALVKVYLCIRTNAPVKDQKLTKYRLENVVTSLDMNALIEAEV